MRAASGIGWALSLLGLLASSRAMADEPVSAREPRLMRETGENTTVVDAFDDDDPFDLHLSLTLRQSWKSAAIRRESQLFQPGLSTGNYVPANENVARFTQSRTVMEIGADVGLYKDLALSLRLPLILADARELGDLDGSSANPQRLQDPNGDALFTVPFKSPTRSGVDWFSAGLHYAIFNQQRDPSKPTWVIGAEGRFAVGPRMRACNESAPVKCPDPANPGVSREPGISRGMNALLLRSIFSRRFGYLEPYTGLELKAEFAQSNSDFGATNDLKGALLNSPPVVGTFLFGVEIIPWENRESFQRVVADLKVRGTYTSPGRDYSELYDALGSSQARSLRSPNPGAYRGDGTGGSVADPTVAPVFFTGVTDQHAFGSVGGSVGITWQAAEFLKFTAGTGLTFVQSHLVTAADACNPDFKGDANASGPCRSTAAGAPNITGIPNPNHRPTIDTVGRRFSVDDTTIVDLWVSGVVMF